MQSLLTHELSNKASILQHIFNAKRAHKEWVKRAEKLVNGLHGYKGQRVDLNVDESFIPLDSSSCQFGQWFNTYGIQLSKFKSIGNFVNRIEEHHDSLHESYAHIYEIFFVIPQKRSILGKLFWFKNRKISDIDREKAKIHLEYLKKTSKELLEVLEVLENKVKLLEYNELQDTFSK